MAEEKEKEGGYLAQSIENGPVTWDSEEDHLLSYFLDDSSHQQQQPHQPVAPLSSSSKYAPDFSNLTISSQPPSTPAVQFYSSSSSNKQPRSMSNQVPRAAPVESASSSSSSLSSMAATLVNGGPVLSQQHQQAAIVPRMPLSSSSSNISPISPAATMGTPQEQLMLPPPPRNNNNKSEAERQQHLAWLNQINTMAMINAANNNNNSTTGAVPVLQQQPMVMPHHHQAPQPLQQQQPLQQFQVFRAPSAPVPPAESEEKRARRLARNRESARQSRRRKKERLATMSQKVNALYNDIEAERRKLLGQLEDELQHMRTKRILTTTTTSQEEESKTTTLSKEELQDLMETLGPNCVVRQTAVSFQYPALRQLILPNYQLFMLWLTAQHAQFFTSGKEEFAKTASRTNSSRVSSKQVGEELTNEWKKKQKKKKKKKSSMDDDDEEEAEHLKAAASDPARLWPLFCFDMSISVDQEEKLAQLHANADRKPAQRMETAQINSTLVSMKRGILNHLQSTAGRSQHLFCGSVLEPRQSSQFQTWYAKNKERVVKQSVATKKEEDTQKTMEISGICKRLNQVLKLPSSDAAAGVVVKMEEDGN